MGKFVITKRINGDYQFVLKANNGQVILASQGYNFRSSCEQGIESVKNNADDDSHYDRKIAENEKHFFSLKAGNGQIIGHSQMYETKQAMETGIDSVKSNAPNATVEHEE
ncbi:YegP family protein [uncultured Chryseobacterium sp.]|uniref:YegP family protein n=1 Tax=uncultured Chryseobacterium sp. TaxID=259322 RepID=UPI00260F50A9|nr:YegP family protein [uncultured Chryseobacterium sp.]